MKTEKSKQIDKTQLDLWIENGIKCHYARLQSPVAPAKDKEPVSEFYIKGPTGKYLVDTMWYTPHGLVWKAFGETGVMPLANVCLGRVIL